MTRQNCPNSYTIRTPMGHKIQVIRPTRQDIERELAAFEAKYGMTSQEFAAKWNRGELDCANTDYFRWDGYCNAMFTKYGVQELKIIYTNVQELKIE